MAAQFRHLLHSCGIPGITIQVLTFRSRGHFTEVPFPMLPRLPEPDLPDLAYLGQRTAAIRTAQARS